MLLLSARRFDCLCTLGTGTGPICYRRYPMLVRAMGQPDWLPPPDRGFMAEDLDRISDLPSHTQLIDGSLVFPSPQSLLHMAVSDWLAPQLGSQAPAQYFVFHRM